MVADQAQEVSGQFKVWVLTVNNPTTTASEFNQAVNDRVPLKYMAIVKEQGDSGTPHYQVYMETLKKQRLQTMKNKLRPLGVWIEPCRGGDKGRDYVMRTGDHTGKQGLLEGPWEFGEYVKHQGQRSDLDAVAAMVVKGDSLKQIATANPTSFMRFHGGIKALKAVLGDTKRSWMTELHIITGVPGSGKSHTASDEAHKYLVDNNLPGDVYFWTAPTKNADKVWFNGYDGERVMVINDFYGTMDIDVFKNLVDKWPYRVEVKNGSTEFLAKAIWITSNAGWTTWWGDKLLSNINNRAAIQRRISSERVFNNVYQEDNIMVQPVVMLDDQPIQGNFFNHDQALHGDYVPQGLHDDLDLTCHEVYDATGLFGQTYEFEDDDDRICRNVANMRSSF